MTLLGQIPHRQLRRNSFRREAQRELQRIALIRFVRSGIGSAAVSNPEVDDEGLTEDAQELLAEYFKWHPKIKARWQAGLQGGDDLDGILVPLARDVLKGVAEMIRQAPHKG